MLCRFGRVEQLQEAFNTHKFVTLKSSLPNKLIRHCRKQFQFLLHFIAAENGAVVVMGLFRSLEMR